MSYKEQRIGHIVAMDRNQCIGSNNKIPWHLPDDLKRFKALTTKDTDCRVKGVVFMGRKTFESMSCKPLSNRFNIILTSDREYWQHHPTCQIVHNVEAGLDMMVEMGRMHDIETAWVIGGERLFKDTIQYADVLEITHVDRDVSKPDVMYPIDLNGYKCAVIQGTQHDTKRNLTYHHATYTSK